MPKDRPIQVVLGGLLVIILLPGCREPETLQPPYQPEPFVPPPIILPIDSPEVPPPVLNTRCESCHQRYQACPGVLHNGR